LRAQHLDELEREVEEKGGVGETLTAHFALRLQAAVIPDVCTVASRELGPSSEQEIHRQRMLRVGSRSGWRIGQGRHMRRDLIGHRLVDDAKLACNAPQVQDIHIEAYRVAAHLLVAALRLVLRRVAATAGLAQVTLAARWVAASFHLPGS